MFTYCIFKLKRNWNKIKCSTDVLLKQRRLTYDLRFSEVSYFRNKTVLQLRICKHGV